VEGKKPSKDDTEVHKPWATPEIFWPEPTRPRPADSKSPVNPTVVLTEPDPALALNEHVPASEDAGDCGNGCGRGSWCAICRAEIREEALRWLRELNVVHQHLPLGLSWSGAWSREVLLANR
jgi:hypothetical protein